jgi:predicted metalloendopeptidase
VRTIGIPRLAAAAVVAGGLSVVSAQVPQGRLPSERPESEARRGVDLAAMDRSADVCTDFYQFACGGWRRANPVPPDRARFGRADEVTERNQWVLRDILESLARADAARAPGAAQVGDFYASCTDERAIDRAGLAPVAALLSQVDGAASKADLSRVVGALRREGIDVLFTLAVVPALADATRTVAEIDQGGLSLPDRGYYTRQDPPTARWARGSAVSSSSARSASTARRACAGSWTP